MDDIWPERWDRRAANIFEWKGDEEGIIILNECGSKMNVVTRMGVIRYQRQESEAVAQYLERVADLIRRSE